MKRLKITKKKRKSKPPPPLESLQIFRRLKRHMAFLVYVQIGDYLYDPDWDWNWHTSILVINASIISSFFFIDLYTFRHDWTHLVYGLCLIPYLIMGLERLMLVYFVRKPFFAMYIKVEKYVEKLEQDTDIRPTLLWYCRKLKWIVYGCTWFFVVGGFFVVVGYTVIIYFVFGKMDLLIAIYIPGLDFHSHPGFEIHVLLHSYLCLITAPGFAVFIDSMIIVLALACAEADIIIIKEQKLHKMLETHGKFSKKITKTLRDIYQLHQEMLYLIDTIEELWSIQQLSDHLIFGSQIILVLYILLQQFWLPGFFMIVVAIFIIFSIDILGTIVEVKLDKLTMQTYDISWYLLSLKHKKDFRYFLSNTQRTARLTLRNGPPLNLDTFVRFCKGIYSYLMVLKETT